MPLPKLTSAPRTILKSGKLVADAWVHLGDDDALPATGDVLVSRERLLTQAEELAARRGAGHRVGVRLTTEDSAQTAAELLDRVDLVALYVPKFADGRFFTTARLLRERHGYQGELRVCGDVVPDQVFYMHRCGIDAFEVPGPRYRLEAALKALGTFSESYQGALDSGPRYRRARRSIARAS